MKNILLTTIIFVLAFLLPCCSNKQEDKELDFNNSYLFVEVEITAIMGYKEGSDKYDVYFNKNKEYYFDEAKRLIKIDTSVSNIQIDTSNKFIFGNIYTDSTSEYISVLQGISANKFSVWYSPMGNLFGFWSLGDINSKSYNIFGIDCDENGDIKMGYRFGSGGEKTFTDTVENSDYEIYKEFIIKPAETFCDSLVRRDFSFNNHDDTKRYNFSYVKEIFTIKNRGFIKKSNVGYYKK